MNVNRDQFIEEGFVIIRDLIPADQLDDLRESYEILVDRQRTVWAEQRTPDEPPGGHWELSAQPRLAVGTMGEQHDESTAPTIEYWLDNKLHDINCQLLDEPDVPVSDMMLMCSPVKDYGRADWHRDFGAEHSAPTESYGGDILENGPRYVQWNIPLYDDNVLWVVPGSHVRANTDEEDASMTKDPCGPLPGGVEADLKAGDGVGYILPILHWPSNYTAKLRRTIHGGFTRTSHYADLSWLDHVSPRAQETFTRWDARSHTYCEMADAALRAVIDGNAPAYRAALDQLWPGRGPKGLLHSTICLGKTATIIFNQHCRTVDELSEFDRGNIDNIHPMTMQWGPRLTDRFTPAEATILHERFKPIDDTLRSDVELHPPRFPRKRHPLPPAQGTRWPHRRVLARRLERLIPFRTLTSPSSACPTSPTRTLLQ